MNGSALACELCVFATGHCKYGTTHWNIAGTAQISHQMVIRKLAHLTIVELPDGGHAVDAPPVLVASTHTVDYCCGSCGIVLMHAEDQQVHSLLIHCTVCGSYNS